MVRLTLHSGKTVSGKVLWLGREKIALDRGGNYDNETLVIAAAEVDRAELRNLSDSSIERIWFLALGAALVCGAYISMHNYGWN